MADNNKDYADQSETRLHTRLEMAVPLLSFGGALIAIVFWITNAPVDFRISIFGCVVSSWALAYLAWIRPRKDIVALSTPIYSFVFIAMETDIFSSVVLQVLYAVSLTILLVRLKHHFGKPGTAADLGKELGDPLKGYIEQIQEPFSEISRETAHNAAVVFVRFAEGNYEDSVQRSTTAIGTGQNTDSEKILIRAFSIIREHAALLDQSLPRPTTFLTFSDQDTPLLAKPPVPGADDDTEFYTALDNALLLLYSIAWNYSERDRPHLLLCQVFANKLMT